MIYEFLGVFYWYVKIPRCGCVENDLKHIAFYVEKYIPLFDGLFWFPAGPRRAVRGARIRETF